MDSDPYKTLAVAQQVVALNYTFYTNVGREERHLWLFLDKAGFVQEAGKHAGHFKFMISIEPADPAPNWEIVDWFLATVPYVCVECPRFRLNKRRDGLVKRVIFGELGEFDDKKLCDRTSVMTWLMQLPWSWRMEMKIFLRSQCAHV